MSWHNRKIQESLDSIERSLTRLGRELKVRTCRHNYCFICTVPVKNHGAPTGEVVCFSEGKRWIQFKYKVGEEGVITTDAVFTCLRCGTKAQVPLVGLTKTERRLVDKSTKTGVKAFLGSLADGTSPTCKKLAKGDLP